MRVSFRTSTWAFAAVTMVMLAVPGLFTVTSFYAYQHSATRAVRAETLGGEIRYLDEVLTMSARLGARSGDPEWRTRYDRHVAELDGAIDAMSALDESDQFRSLLQQTDAANQALISMETRAFDLADGGRYQQGFALVMSRDYLEQKAIYAKGLERASQTVRDSFAKRAGQLWEQLTLAAVVSTLGAVIAFFGWFVFIARMLRRQDALNEQVRNERDAAHLASKAKSHFLANMSHELRTPLNAIIGYGELLQETATQDHRTNDAKDLGRVLAAAKHLLTLINDLLDLSRIEAGKFAVHPHAQPILPMLNEVVATIEPAIAKRNNRLQCTFADDLGTAHTDGLRLTQCLLNLLSNAAKFTTDGIIGLSARRESGSGQDWLTFAVTDTGCGMSPEQLARIFEPFVQADSNTTCLHGGAGLGLSITRQLAQLLGGEVAVTSAPGAGACFTLRIPAKPIAVAGADCPIAAQASRAA